VEPGALEIVFVQRNSGLMTPRFCQAVLNDDHLYLAYAKSSFFNRHEGSKIRKFIDATPVLFGTVNSQSVYV